MKTETSRDAAPAAAPEASSGFNLSRWALDHRPLTRYLMVVLMLMGGFTYFQLGQDEDPPFTFRAMVVRTLWPGATTQQMAELVTAKLERSLQEVPYADKIRSYSKPGESQIILELKDYSKPSEVAGVWYSVRKKIGDIRHTLPAGVQGPFFNDEFGDVYGIIYALESDGFSNAEVKTIADQLRQQLLRVKDVAKVEIFGAQDEKIFIDISKGWISTRCLTSLHSKTRFSSQVHCSQAMTCCRFVWAGSFRLLSRLRRCLFGAALAARPGSGTLRKFTVVTLTPRRSRCITRAVKSWLWVSPWSRAATSCAWVRH